MADVPVQLIVAAFNDEKAANQALRQLKIAKWSGLIGIKDAAVIRRDKRDKIHINDVRDVAGGQGAVAGGIFGVGIALLTGGAGILLSGAAGALVGGLTARAIDMGLPNDRLKELGSSLKPETSAIVAIIEHKWVAELEKELQKQGANVMIEALKADISEQLEAGKDVAFTAVATEGAVTASRVAGDEQTVELSGITITEEGIAAQATVASKEGALTKNLLLTNEGLASSEVMISAEGVTGEGVVVTQEGAAVAQFAATPVEDADEGEGEGEAKEDAQS